METQADRYIRDHRVATLIVNDEDPQSGPQTISLTPDSYHTTTHHDRNIALLLPPTHGQSSCQRPNSTRL